VEAFSNRYEACNLVFRRAAFLESAGFDEVVGHFWEDVAAGAALTRIGWRAAFEPAALVHHDVTYPGFWWHVKRMMRNTHLGPVVRHYPEIRRDVLYLRVFLAPRDARFLLALVGVVLAPRQPLAPALVLPYVVTNARRQEPLPLPRLKAYAQVVVYDAARFVSMLGASVRGRTVLL
jgi:hypothetical protein